ncbi:hypothetical protein MMC12_003292 [Toensbergia leucococca]|nr:hypothetical protein [Toensbergia leucococca]
MNFAVKINDGHFGARKFWHSYLGRLKYHNPAVSMTLNRTNDQSGPAILTVFFAPPAAPMASPAPPLSTSITISPSQQMPFDRTESIDMKHKHESEILSRLMSITNASPVLPTPEEEVEMLQMEDDRKTSEQDALTMAQVYQKMKREKALLLQARGDVEKVKAQA